MTDQTTYYKDLVGAHIFITGGATGIGAQLVTDFSNQGSKVSFIDIDESSATSLCETIEQQGINKPNFKCVDVTNVDDLQNSVNEAIKINGNIYALINNVANDTRHSPEELTEEAWRNNLAVNLDPTFFASQAVIPSMQALGQGSIINIGSISALLGQPDMLGYVTAKAGLMGLTRSLARAYGSSKIRVNTIMPGWVVTERQDRLWRTPEIIEEWSKHVALKDDLMPSDISNLALFLASNDSKMITAQEIIIDAGRM